MALANPCPESPIPWREREGREGERERETGRERGGGRERDGERQEGSEGRGSRTKDLTVQHDYIDTLWT